MKTMSLVAIACAFAMTACADEESVTFTEVPLSTNVQLETSGGAAAVKALIDETGRRRGFAVYTMDSEAGVVRHEIAIVDGHGDVTGFDLELGTTRVALIPVVVPGTFDPQGPSGQVIDEGHVMQVAGSSFMGFGAAIQITLSPGDTVGIRLQISAGFYRHSWTHEIGNVNNGIAQASQAVSTMQALVQAASFGPWGFLILQAYSGYAVDDNRPLCVGGNASGSGGGCRY